MLNRQVTDITIQSFEHIYDNFSGEPSFDYEQFLSAGSWWLLVTIREHHSLKFMYYLYEEVSPDRYVYRWFIQED